ncbi:unnamed protein product [Parascedosporium putredinis]|uniref:Uncharacterized protein n=1 Tax=Parascedosporium putredinis TaxID=1442378 RepID=A0A9P1MD59_9PEZI|nr:unnamed protein product [Parascedosporium putredinis]CAI7998980.1 unnamed protein product [Parascedosporium putredinis]
MSARAIPALTTVRGFTGAPIVSGDEDSDYSTACETPPPSTRHARPRFDDVVSANCSPSLRPVASPAVSGIAKLRQAMEPLSLDASSRTSTLTLSGSQLGFPRFGANHNGLSSVGMSRCGSRDTVSLEHDFVSETVREKSAMFGAVEEA